MPHDSLVYPDVSSTSIFPPIVLTILLPSSFIVAQKHLDAIYMPKITEIEGLLDHCGPEEGSND